MRCGPAGFLWDSGKAKKVEQESGHLCPGGNRDLGEQDSPWGVRQDYSREGARKLDCVSQDQEGKLPGAECRHFRKEALSGWRGEQSPLVTGRGDLEEASWEGWVYEGLSGVKAAAVS